MTGVQTCALPISLAQTLQRASDLAPVLLERAARAETERVLLPETVRDLTDAGILRAMQPRRWGGMEYDYIAYVDIAMALARGCASTSWCVVNLMIHNWMLAQYDERAQAEVWDSSPDVLIAAGIAYPQGRAVKADGGYIINGRWNFSSAVHVSEWCMLAVTLRDDSGNPAEYRMCLLDKTQYEVIDDWQVMGMRSTGSMTVVAKDVFERRMCADCHVVERVDREEWRVQPVKLTQQWMPAANFDHAAHGTSLTPCSTCHAAEKSREAAEILMPGIKVCRD